MTSFRILEIPCDGETTEHLMDKEPSLQWMQETIGCRVVEFINVWFHGEYRKMIVDEEGLWKQPCIINFRATSVYHCNWIHHEGKIPDAPVVGKALLFLEGDLE
ncbi:hypothetical protein [[Eubacterium] cellulosolvens]